MIVFKRCLIVLSAIIGFSAVCIVLLADKTNSEEMPFSYSIEDRLMLDKIIAEKDSGIAQAVFFNYSDQMLDSFYVEVFTQCGQYYFETTILPPYSYVILSDRDNRTWVESEIIKLHGEVKYSNVYDDSLVCAVNVSQGYLIIQHSQTIDRVDVYLKICDTEQNMFTQDKTYKISLQMVYAGDVVCVKLPDDRYKIVSIYKNGIHIVSRSSQAKNCGGFL